MEYRIGSLADAISGKNDAPASNTRVVFVPKKDEPSMGSRRAKLRGQRTHKSAKAVKRVGFKDEYTTVSKASKRANWKVQNESPLEMTVVSKKRKVEVENQVGIESKASKRAKLEGQNESPLEMTVVNKKRKVEVDNQVGMKDGGEKEEKYTSRVLQRKHRRLKKKKLQMTRNRLVSKGFAEKIIPESKEDEDNRTIFVKNLPKTIDKKKIQRRFKKFGEIETVRIRCAVPEDPRVRKKVAVILKKLHPQRSNVGAFVRYKSAESAEKALKADDIEIDDHHIFISRVGNSKPKYSNKNAIFVGNLPYDVEEDDLYKIFKICGKIVNISVVRDKPTGMCLGTAFVNYEDNDGVELALMMGDVKLKERELRVFRSDPKRVKKEVKKGPTRNKPKLPKKEKSKLVKKRKRKENRGQVETKVDSFGKEVTNKSKVKPRHASSQGKESEEKCFPRSSLPVPKSNFDFQGLAVDRTKKKKKMNKDSSKKKALAQILSKKKEYVES